MSATSFGRSRLRLRPAQPAAERQSRHGSFAIGYAWDNAGRLASTTAGGKTLGYQYDAAGNRTRITWPEATAFYVTTAYDELNQPTVIKELGAATLATYTYDDLSRRTSVALGNTTTTAYGYDAQGMLQTLSHDLAGSAQDVAFTYARNQDRRSARAPGTTRLTRGAACRTRAISPPTG